MIIFTLLWSLPLLMMVFASFKTDQEALTNPFAWPRVWSIDAYRYAWKALDYSGLLWNRHLILSQVLHWRFCWHWFLPSLSVALTSEAEL